MPHVLILDCGATNLRAIAVNERGEIISSHHYANATHADPDHADYHVWDFEEIWTKLLDCAKHVVTALKRGGEAQPCIAIGVTTFGVDGAPYDAGGRQCFPVISWKCPRTVPVMQGMAQWVDVEKLYQCNGIGQYSFNTLFKLRWLQENRRDVYRAMDKFVFISSMITHRLTGVLTTDKTMAGTSMMTDLHTGTWIATLLETLQLTPAQFPPLVEAGAVIGGLKAAVAQELGLPADIPVVSCGHDTQFAILGSGAALNQPVLSSGTWEILMARTHTIEPDYALVPQGLTTEFDAQTGLYNPAVQWIGSGILEWIGGLFYRDIRQCAHYYATMIEEARNCPIGANGIRFDGNFTADDRAEAGKIRGLSIHATRGAIYRATLEFLAKKLTAGLAMLQQVGHFQAERLLCVGGGSKNALWNQIRADMLNLPIDVTDVAESTVLGAAMTVLYGVGYYPDLATAQKTMAARHHRVLPSADAPLYQEWLKQ